MKNYKKPEIKIEKFDVIDVITTSDGYDEPFPLSDGEVFYGIDPDEQGYLIEQ